MEKARRVFRSVLKSEVMRNTSILISGTVLAQLIPILLQPLLRRYYSPETFGAYAVYLSLLGILIVVSSFKYELAIILPKKDKEAANLFFLSVFLNFGFNLLLLLVVVFWKNDINKFLNLSDKFVNYLYIVPLGTFLFSFYQSINYWLIRKKKFIAISQNKFVRRGAEGTAQIGFKFLKLANGLIYGDIIGHIANIISISIQSLKSGLKIELFSFKKIRYVFFKYNEYPKFNVIPSLMSACSYLLPAILINKFYTSENVGYFDLSKLVLSIPFALIATSIGNVLLQDISEKYKQQRSIIRGLYQVSIVVLLIAIFEIIIILIFGVGLFKLFFGEKWGISGQISKILVWSYALNFIVGSFSCIFISMKKIKILSVWQLIYFTAIVSLFLFRDYLFIDFLKVYVIIEVTCYLIVMAIMIAIILKYESKIKKII